jgi:hypothetical protein
MIYYTLFSWRMVVLEPFPAEIRLCNLVYWWLKGPLEELPNVCVDPHTGSVAHGPRLLTPIRLGFETWWYWNFIAFFLSHHPLLPMRILALTLGIVHKVYHYMSYPSTCHIKVWCKLRKRIWECAHGLKTCNRCQPSQLVVPRLGGGWSAPVTRVDIPIWSGFEPCAEDIYAFVGLSYLAGLRIHSSDSYFFHTDFLLDLWKSSTKRGFECWVENSVVKTAI